MGKMVVSKCLGIILNVHSCLLGDGEKSMTAGQGKPSPEPLPRFQVPESHAYLKQRNSFQQVGCLTARPQDHGKAQL